MLLAVNDFDAKTHLLVMPRSNVAAGQACLEELLSRGLVVSTQPKAGRWLQQYLNHECFEAKKRVRLVNKCGWHEGRLFILPERAFGETGGEVFHFQGDGVALHQAGTLKKWQEHVAKPAVGNSGLVLALSASFAGPLLEPLGEESGGFHFRGISSIGKSTLLASAASVWGMEISSWRSTDNAAEGVAAAHSDCLLTMDEISQADPRAVSEIAYMLANQRGKARMNKDLSVRPPSTWRLMFLSSGEPSLEAKLSEAGKTLQAGQHVRMIDIPADAGVGHGVFEDLHGFAGGAELTAHLKKFTRHGSAEGQYGRAAPAFLKKLVDEREALTIRAAGFRDRWLTEHLPARATEQVQRVARRFALVAAAGELAASLGVLPWPEGEASKGVARCFEAWQEARGSSQVPGGDRGGDRPGTQVHRAVWVFAIR
jgi:putative DNA primase/helicase